MSVIRRHPVLTFFLLAYALCWAAIPWQSFFAPGVLVAAVIVVSLTEGVAGLKAMGSRLIRWRVSWIWYAIAIAVPLAVKFAAIGLNSALGAPVPDIAEFSVWYGLPMAIAINIVNPLNAQLPEEASFRGWAQPKLQTTRTPLAATVLMAVGVTIWHIPFFVMPQFGSSPVEATATVAVTFWYAWLFNHASGSSLITLIAHATEGTIETSTLWQAAGDTTRMTWLWCLVWCLVALGLLVFDRRFWTKPPAAASSRTVTSAPVVATGAGRDADHSGALAHGQRPDCARPPSRNSCRCIPQTHADAHGLNPGGCSCPSHHSPPTPGRSPPRPAACSPSSPSASTS